MLLNKPSGYICTKAEHVSEINVMKLLKQSEQTAYPVGRLDKNTTGLLLLTNDGDFAYKVTHPSKEIDKVYLAYCLGKVSEQDLRTIEKGIELYDGKTAPCKAVFKSYNHSKDLSAVEITIHEGKKRQVRRMFASIDHPVKHLARIKLGILDLKGVKEGTYRKLTREEIDFFKKDED